MKKCTYCGKEYPDETSVCAIDQNPLESVAPPREMPLSADERQSLIDKEHLKLLSIFHFVVAGLALCAMFFLFVHYLMMSQMFSNPNLWKSTPNPPPKDFFKFFIWFYIFFGVIFFTAGFFNLLAGLFLLKRRHRIFSLVVAGLNCLQIPFGTILGIFTIMVLSRDSVRKIYRG
jgi:hypothetical protein